jgi:hypothetical protein
MSFCLLDAEENSFCFSHGEEGRKEFDLGVAKALEPNKLEVYLFPFNHF